MSGARRGRVPVLLLLLLLPIAAFLASSSDASASPKRARKKTAKRAAPVDFDTHLPVLGTKLAEFPAGPGKSLADQGCVFCHSADMATQQHLTEKQWTAEVTKMTSWGADVPADKRDELIAYLVKNFGPESPRYVPVVTRPVGR